MQLTGGCQHLIGARSHANVFGKVVPANGLRSIDQELGRTRNVVSLRTSADMQQMVLSDHTGVRIGKNRECVAGLPGQVSGDRRDVDTDCNRPHSCRFEFGQPLFDTS
jgi:hypothetical protein